MSEHRHDDAVDPFSMTCAELVELVTDYLEGALDPGQRARIDAHLTVCPPCVHVIDQWRAVIELTGALDDTHAEQLDPHDRAQLMAAFRDASPTA